MMARAGGKGLAFLGEPGDGLEDVPVLDAAGLCAATTGGEAELKWSILYRRALVSRVASSPHRAAINRRQKPLRRVCARLVRRHAKRFAMMLTDCLSQQERRVMTGSQGISRRQVLTIAAGAAGASVTGAAAVIGTSTPAQAAK